MHYWTVILSPELMYDQQFMELWTDARFRKQISHIIIDEAHCVSTWGRSFQSAYLKVRIIQLIFRNEVQWYLMSATMPPDVLWDVLTIIDLPRKMDVYQRSNDRPNIHLAVCTMTHMLHSHFDLAFLLPMTSESNMLDTNWKQRNVPQFLVYCNSRANTISTALFLHSWLPPSTKAQSWVAWFHSGMTSEFKKEVMKKYEVEDIWGICCTDACGMVY